MQQIPNHQTAVVILAGGSSSRLGKPKQLLHYQEQTFIKNVVKTALQIAVKPVIVVTGFLHEKLVLELKNLPVQIVRNTDWKEGMGSSIRAGVSALKQSENSDYIDAVLILLSDQPLITSEHLNQLISQFYQDKRSTIAATGYAETQGVPAVFGKNLFTTLELLPENRGAQWLFKKYREELIVVPFAAAAVDVDTEEDYFQLLKLSENQQK